LSENMGTIVQTKGSGHRTTPGAIVGTAGRPRSEICLPSSGPRRFGVPSRARVGCPACSGISHNTLKFIDLDQARFSVGAGDAERPRNDLRPRGSSVDWATICRRDEIGWAARFKGCDFFRVQPIQEVCRASDAWPVHPTASPRGSRSTARI